MALAALATTADLSVRGVDITTNAALVSVLLGSASEAVRDAAGSAITQQTSTFDIPAAEGQWLTLPMTPVTAVTTVLIDGEAVTDYKLVGGRLWRYYGWQASTLYGAAEVYGPTVVTVTATHGLAEVPADIVDLVCSLVAAGVAAAGDGYDPRRSLAYESVDDYRLGFRQGDAEVVNPLLIPERTREWLRSRFGGGTYTTRVTS